MKQSTGYLTAVLDVSKHFVVPKFKAWLILEYDSTMGRGISGRLSTPQLQNEMDTPRKTVPISKV